MNQPNPYGPQPHQSGPQNSYPPVPQQLPTGWQAGPSPLGPNPQLPPPMAPLQKAKSGHWWSGRLAIGIGAGVLGLVIGTAGSTGSTSTATADPAPAVTVTARAEPAPTVTVTASPKPAPVAAPEPKKVEPSKPAPKAAPKPAKAKNPSSRDWAKVVKNPDRYKGKRYVIYGEVSQFDSATGDDTFLADTAHRNTTSYGFFDGENTMLTGSAGKLEDLVEDDVFRATVTVSGSFSYDTQVGGNTTVPLLEVEKIKVTGHN